jgi:hypothetical protein
LNRLERFATLVFDNLAVEAFVHDPETLKYFFFEVDLPSGVVPSLAIVMEGLDS